MLFRSWRAGHDDGDGAGRIWAAQVEETVLGGETQARGTAGESVQPGQKLHTSARRESRATLRPGPPWGGRRWWSRGDYENAERTFGVRGRKKKAVKSKTRASLVAQWLRICLPMQGTRVRALVWEDPTCHGATKPVRHNY